MSRKDRMLSHIINNVNWFMTTSNFEVIPYYELTSKDFNRAKQYFASSAEFSDVVCLISTSIMDIGKSGILFTTDYVYSKAWGGIFTGSYKNWIYSSFIAEFDVINEFNTERMKELMSDLADIGIEENDREKVNDTIKKVENFGKVMGTAALVGMTIIDVLSRISDSLVSQNNQVIADEVSQLGDSETSTTCGMEIYNNFIPLINSLIDFLAEQDDVQEDDIEEETALELIKKVNDILIELYNQTLENTDISLEDSEEYSKHCEWLTFWAMMFCDSELFKETYQEDILQEMPDIWEAISQIVDEFTEDIEGPWEDVFSDTLYDFGEVVLDNIKSFGLMSESEIDDDFIESMNKIIESNNTATKALKNALDVVTEFFLDILSNDEEED